MTKTTTTSTGPTQPHPPRTPIERAVIELGQHVRNELDQACDGQAFRGGYDSWIMRWKKRSPAPTLRIPHVVQALTVLAGYDTNDRRMRKEQARLARELLASLFRPDTPIDRPLWFLHWIPVAEIEALANLDIFSVRDLLYHLPRRYDDRSTYTAISELQDETHANVIGMIIDQYPATIGQQQRPVTVVVVSDGLARMRAVFYTQNPPILRETDALSRVAFTGKVVRRRLHGEPLMPTMFNPNWVLYGQADAALHTGGLIPIHPLTRGVSDRKLRQRIDEVLTAYAEQLEYLPSVICSEFGLLPLADALRQVHFPTDDARLKEARRRLAFDELLILQLGIFRRKTDDAVEGCSMPVVPEAQQAFLSALPFTLTGAQEQAIAEIGDDMSRSVPMTRLVQGDVGSGKTAVAMAAAVASIANGYQVALMAPTELLAEQHLMTFRELLGRVRVPRERHTPHQEDIQDGPKQDLFAMITAIAEHLGFEEIGHDRNIRIEGLSGGMKGQQRRHIHAALARGDIDLVVGTHALISRAVAYARLGLVIVDEQHRFGVDQRRRLAAKGLNPHVLMLTATPIPRTTIQVYYGELGVSVLAERPPGRKPILTQWLTRHERHQAYERVRAEVEAGRQVFVICPVIEEHADLDWPAAEERYKYLKHWEFPDRRIELLHGRMHDEQKDRLMRQFRDGKYDILVSTQVVEVGIDIPNATVIVIEGADRFGFAQLHQLRGRVGRGQCQSYCYLVSDATGPEAEARLRKVCETDDGFALARSDLQLRGPGEFFGDRQSGAGDFKVARYWEWDTLRAAQQAARQILERDPALALSEHAAIAVAYRLRWENMVTGA